MAGEPFNYSINAQNPVDAMFGGMQFGQQQRAGEQQMQLAQAQEQRAQTQFGQENIMFDQAQQDRAAALKAAMEAKAQAAKMQQDLAGLAGKIRAGGVTSSDFTAIAAQYPDLTDEMAKMWDGQTAERKAEDTANVFKAAAAIKAGKPEIALDMLEERALAAEASGDKQEADISRALAAGIKADPSAALATLGLLLHSVDEKANVELFGEAADAELPADARSMQWRAEEAGLVKGTPEYKEFIKTEGKAAAGGGKKVRVNADGSVEVIQDGPAVGLKMTEGEGKATGFMYRMTESNKVLDDLDNQGSSLWNKVAGGVPVLGNYMVSENAQKYDQAKRDFINAVLRRESGAVISPEEFKNAEIQYFPQPGDGQEVVAQKKRNRMVAIDGVRASAGAGGLTNASPADGQGSQPAAPASQGSVEDDLAKYGAPAP